MSRSHTTIDPRWSDARRQLLQNVGQQGFEPHRWPAVHAIVRRRKVFLPAYAPYVGQGYFQHRPRVLCYAINQNLSPHVRWTKDWLDRWGGDRTCAQDRLNQAVLEGQPLPIRPYAEGFMPLVALMAMSRWVRRRRAGRLPRDIDHVVATTNFVKFSTADDASSTGIPAAWWRECGHQYVLEEIRVLRPDILVGFGQKTIAELRRVLNDPAMTEAQPEFLGCRFPARIASTRSRPLSADESAIWEKEISPLTARMRAPRLGSYHGWRMHRFPGYFVDIFQSWNGD